MSDLSVANELAAAPAAPAAAPAAPAAAPVAATPVAAPTATAAAPVSPPAEDALKLPGKDAKPEEWSAFYAKLGAPKDAAGYKLEVPEGQDGAFAKAAAGKFAELGLMPQQAEGLNKWWNETVAAQTKAAQDAEAAAVAAAQAQAQRDDAALKNEFQGEAYTVMKNNAGKAVREFFPGDKEQQVAALSALESVLGYGGLYRMLNKIGEGLGEGKLRGVGSDAPPAKPDLATALFGDVLAKAGFGPKQ